MEQTGMEWTTVLIETEGELDEICKTLLTLSFITVDTEFMLGNKDEKIDKLCSEITPGNKDEKKDKLCLVQIGNPVEEVVYLIDCIKLDCVTKKLRELCEKPSIVKVFHDARKDVKMLCPEGNFDIINLFDTQIAHLYLHNEKRISYKGLVNELCNVTLDKSETRSDWKARPLTPKQIEYAASDVTHLVMCYERLKIQLQEKNRYDWVIEDCKRLGLRTTVDPSIAWIKIRKEFEGCYAKDANKLTYFQLICEHRSSEAKKQHKRPTAILANNTLKKLLSTSISKWDPTRVPYLTHFFTWLQKEKFPGNTQTEFAALVETNATRVQLDTEENFKLLSEKLEEICEQNTISSTVLLNHNQKILLFYNLEGLLDQIETTYRGEMLTGFLTNFLHSLI